MDKRFEIIITFFIYFFKLIFNVFSFFRRLIQEALNRQTFHQFKAYAEKQYPGDPEQASVIIFSFILYYYNLCMEIKQFIKICRNKLIFSPL